MTVLASRPRVDRSFERLYQRHVADVYRYALAVVRNQSDAEDVTQTTFLNAYSAFRRGERPRAPRSWLIAIAHNVCRQRFRQSSRRPQEVAWNENVGEQLVDDDAPSAYEIRRALSFLAFNQRAALVMRELEGRSYAEIAAILGVTVASVETLVFRARRALREQLEGSLTCEQAEFALSRQLDGRLPRAERGSLRAHLRECPECAGFARKQRAQRAGLRSLAAIPLPASLASFFGGGGAVGTGVAAKTAAVVAVGALFGGVAYEGATRLPVRQEEARAVPARAPAASGSVLAASAAARAEPAASRPAAALPGAEAADPTAKPPRGKGLAKGHAKAASARTPGTVDLPAAAAAPPGHVQVRTHPGRERAIERAGNPRGQARGHAGARPARAVPASAEPKEEKQPAPKPDPPGRLKKSETVPPAPQGHGKK